MRGDWIAAVAARLLRDETFAQTVAPAVADLQFETRFSGPATLARGYLGVARAVALAGLADLRGDLATSFADDTVRQVWLRALAVYAVFAVITTAMVVADADARYRLTAAGSTLADVTVAMLPVMMAIGAHGLVRHRPDGRRSLAAATAVVMLMTWTVAFSTRPARNALVANHEAARWLVAAQDGATHARQVTHDRTVPELAEMLNQARSAEFRQGHYWTDVRIGASVPAMALVGLSLSRSHG
jgi:hypothetical protein